MKICMSMFVGKEKEWPLGKEWGSLTWKWSKYELFLELSKGDHTKD
jgi:hypothetical protein